ncbi:MAG: hypothetical protein QOH96_2707, partial [Blastocatellia bacterium]|nr:hypothetical protein [Blastocatellia bacterium]
MYIEPALLLFPDRQLNCLLFPQP